MRTKRGAERRNKFYDSRKRKKSRLKTAIKAHNIMQAVDKGEAA